MPVVASFQCQEIISTTFLQQDLRHHWTSCKNFTEGKKTSSELPDAEILKKRFHCG